MDDATAAKGTEVYDSVCAACHNTGVNRAPSRMILGQMTPDAIHRALTDGVMKMQGSLLTPDQKVAVAEVLTKRKMGTSHAVAPLMCTRPRGGRSTAASRRD